MTTTIVTVEVLSDADNHRREAILGSYARKHCRRLRHYRPLFALRRWSR